MFLVTGFYWQPYVDAYGHASLLLPDGTYISWGPQGAKHPKNKSQMRGVPAEPAGCLQEDITAEGGRNPERYVGPVKSVQNIKTWWESNRYKGTYHFLQNNCCDMVIKALKAGGVDVASNWFYPNRPNELAEKLKAYRRDMFEGAGGVLIGSSMVYPFSREELEAKREAYCRERAAREDNQCIIS